MDKIEDKDAAELIFNLLNFNSNKRPCAKEVLFESKYLKEFRDKIPPKIESIEYPKDYDIISKNINHKQFIEILEKINDI